MITSYEARFMNGHVTKPVKDALRRAASRREDRSMSKLLSEAVEELLTEQRQADNQEK